MYQVVLFVFILWKLHVLVKSVYLVYVTIECWNHVFCMLE